ncbi:amidohydrolase family protein [Pseudohongiella sp.]|uniref:Amidohydrolase-related domain-containing protein n=1 Tax=marine sediment metagenome TaxID=412755 RepID=A0A0F9WK15_9ZZZZ|nr:amidohydrolase family protein [Pseudohongiella sp.]HDZ09529.1 amidohydrolase [Pseudohongiella sp.]HEA63487.1 amidohydrolase [Pseudohongiella sp.]
MRFFICWLATMLMVSPVFAQETATPNGIADNRRNAIALTGATVYLPGQGYQEDATVLVRDGVVVNVVAGTDARDGYFAIDMAGKYVYPGFIDLYSGYGLPTPGRPVQRGGAEVVRSGNQAYNANDAIRSHYRAVENFTPDADSSETLRDLGFSSVLSHHADGIARGTSTLVTLGNHNANEAVVIADAAAHYSLDKGSSSQTVPVSLMGSVALLRQTYLDAQWFAAHEQRPFVDESLEGWIRAQSLPQIMEVDNWHQALTVDGVAQEFDTDYVIRVGTDAYQQAEKLAATGARLIVPVNYPDAPDVADPFIADEVSFSDLKHWELAPYNLRLLSEAGIEFALTSAGAGADFWDNLRQAVANGLPHDDAIAGLTTVPARILGVSDRLGQLDAGALANMVVTSGPLFDDDTVLLENWVRGERFVLNTGLDERRGQYSLMAGNRQLAVALDFADGGAKLSLLDGNAEPDADASVDASIGNDLISLTFTAASDTGPTRLSGWSVDNGWQGTGQTAAGEPIDWRLTYTGPLVAPEPEPDSAPVTSATDALPSPVLYPFSAYGSESLPAQQDVVIRNATVWTNEDMGILVTDVLVRDGRIAAVGDNLSAGGAVEVDGTGKHLTPGIIDEHTHIALFSINEIATNSSMVRMQDVVNSEDVNIYRNLAGGVVAAQQLHGSSNPIGGQSSIIKLRWGMAPEELQLDDAPKFIKFALGENVKRSTNPASIRYPQTRMGVEQVYVNAFSQAQQYEQRWNAYNALSNAQRRDTVMPRRDLVHETMLEVLKGERYVTNHSYVQSEINMMMTMAESFGFNINTFTHILEGYKVADKMAAHGAGGSTFSDWWAFKWEVRYAIPYNAALMQLAGVVVALNSDDAEMSRRLNQEAGKMVKYGNVSESDALKMITLNPAKLLHLDDRMGSIREGKDADLVLWDEHPLSVYAQAQTTWVDGVPYFDRARDQQLRQYIADERARLIAAIISEEE